MNLLMNHCVCFVINEKETLRKLNVYDLAAKFYLTYVGYEPKKLLCSPGSKTT
jgi:hypothetical protein